MEAPEGQPQPNNFLDDLANLAEKFWIVKKRKWLKWLVIGIASCIAAVVAAIFLIIATAYITLHFPGEIRNSKGKPLDWSKLARSDYKKESIAYAKDGEIIERYFAEPRDRIKIEEVPPLLVEGFIAAEDKRFYAHSGVDYGAVVKALIRNLRQRFGLFCYHCERSGGSGITQQLARRLYDEDIESFKTLEQSYGRKILEGRVAIQIEKRYSKNQIMEGFLNVIYLGDGARGVAEAVHREFGKNIRKDPLTPREVAIIVARNKSPEKYSPFFHEPKKPAVDGLNEKARQKEEARYQAEFFRESHRVAIARDRYDWVLSRMFDEGYLSKKDYDAAVFGKDDPPHLALLHLAPFRNSEFGHAARMVKELLFMQGWSDEDILYRRGLRIKTTLDESIQNILSEEIERQYRELNREINTKEKIEGAAIVIENKTGRIVAMVGSHDFKKSQFDRVFSLRSPGSAFKPITVAAAFEQGWGLYDKVCNCSFSLPDKIDVHGRVLKRWAPRNFPEKNAFPAGYNDLTPTLFRSVNLGILDLARRIRIKPIIEMAHRMGVRGYKDELMDPDGKVWFRRPGAKDNQKGLEPYLPTAIGGSGASLIELATAYSEFARGGTYIRPTIITEIRDSEGTLLYKAPKPKEERVMSEETARKMTVVLRAVTKIGTLKISGRGLKQEMAAKTGTSNGPEDLSVMSYNPELTIAIRFGYDMPREIAVPEYMKRVSGGGELHVSAGWTVGPAWKRIVNRTYEKRKTVDFTPGVEDEVKEVVVKYRNYQ